MSGMFLPPTIDGLLGLFGVGTPAEHTAEPAPTPEPEPPATAYRTGIPTLDEAVADIRRDMRNSLALQSKSASAPPLIVVVNWAELTVVMAHVDATLETETP